jgi:hypothetical protein
MVIVLGRPTQQLPQAAIEHRCGIEHFENGPQTRCRHLRVIGKPRYDTDQALSAEGDAHACPDRGLNRAASGRKIIKQPAQGGIERHPQDLWHVR